MKTPFPSYFFRESRENDGGFFVVPCVVKELFPVSCTALIEVSCGARRVHRSVNYSDLASTADRLTGKMSECIARLSLSIPAVASGSNHTAPVTTGGGAEKIPAEAAA